MRTQPTKWYVYATTSAVSNRNLNQTMNIRPLLSTFSKVVRHTTHSLCAVKLSSFSRSGPRKKTKIIQLCRVDRLGRQLLTLMGARRQATRRSRASLCRVNRYRCSSHQLRCLPVTSSNHLVSNNKLLNQPGQIATSRSSNLGSSRCSSRTHNLPNNKCFRHNPSNLLSSGNNRRLNNNRNHKCSNLSSPHLASLDSTLLLSNPSSLSRQASTPANNNNLSQCNQ